MSYPKLGDIWYYEEEEILKNGILFGKRFIFVISNNKWNRASGLINGFPLTTTVNEKSPVHVRVRLPKKNIDSFICCEQWKTIPQNSLGYLVCRASNNLIRDVYHAVDIQMGRSFNL